MRPLRAQDAPEGVTCEREERCDLECEGELGVIEHASEEWHHDGDDGAPGACAESGEEAGLAGWKFVRDICY